MKKLLVGSLALSLSFAALAFEGEPPPCKDAVKSYAKGMKKAKKQLKKVKRYCKAKKPKRAKCTAALVKLSQASNFMDMQIVNAACAGHGAGK